MSRIRRISPALIAALGVVLALGLMFWLHNVSRNKAVAEATESLRAELEAARLAAIPAPVVSSARAQESDGAPQTSVAATTEEARSIEAPLPTLAAVTNQPVNERSSEQPLVEARAAMEAGRLLEARRILNAAMDSGRLSATDIATAKQLVGTINKTVIFSTRRFADDPHGGTYTVQRGDLLQRIASRHDVTWEFLCRINGISDPRKLQAGQTIKVIQGPFHAVVHKRAFTMDIYFGSPGERGSMYVTSFPVGLGADDSTPSGVWMVEPHKKIKNPTYYSPRGEGIIAADDPNNPLGEYWIGLTGIDGDAVGKLSYGIHGTIEPETIGKQASLGCIRLHNEDVELVFELLVEGKSIVIVKD